MTDTIAEQARRHLLRPDRQEDVSLATYTVSTGRHRITMLLHRLLLPGSGDRTVHGNAAFTSRYILRGAAQAAEAGHGLVLLHSHPCGSGWQLLSRTDHDTEQSAAHIAEEYTGRRLIGMTLAGDGSWSARIWRSKSTSPVWAESVRVVGSKSQVSWNDDLLPPPPATASQVRTIAAWGAMRQAAIARLRVLVVGVGSVGLDVALRLAATGITDIGVMDPDVVEELNLDRMIGATRSDARRERLKVDVARRLILAAATAKNPQVKRFPISVCTPEGLRRALDYDVIFSCVDRPWPRAVLNSVAYADLVPVVDGGLALETFSDGTMRSGSWRAHTLVPGRPCMLCTGQLNFTDLQLDRQGLLDDSTYIERSGREPASGAPNVAAYSAFVSAALLAQFVSLTAHPGHQGVPAPLRYVLSVHDLHRLQERCGEHCPYESITAAGDGRTPLTAPRSAGPAPPRRRRRLVARLAAVLRSLADRLD